MPKTTHLHCSGGRNSRLYTCWLSMKRRSTMRGDACYVCPEWKTFKGFLTWSEANGYDDNKVLCRYKDLGGYSPDNARWDTVESNQADERESKKQTFTYYKDGEPVIIHGLVEFCREHKLNPSHMVAIRNPNRERKSHKGYTYIN